MKIYFKSGTIIEVSEKLGLLICKRLKRYDFFHEKSKLYEFKYESEKVLINTCDIDCIK